MITLDQFIASAEEADLRLTVDRDGLQALSRPRDDAFFQAPLLSFCVVVIAKGRAGELRTSDVPNWVGSTLTKHFDNSAAIRRQLEWSLDYRRRCADAIVFLENVDLVSVSGEVSRTIRCTEAGNKFLRDALKQPDEIGILARALTKAHRIVEHHGLELF
jgi:hypothetical protein